MTERTVLCQRAGAVSRNWYDTAKPDQSSAAIVLQPRTGRNITEVMAIRPQRDRPFSWPASLPF
jgi:hypothetical protein